MYSTKKRTRFDDVMLVGSAIAAAACAAHAVSADPLAAHDESVIRVVGLGWTGPFRALDVLVSSVAMLLPVGAHTVRAALASAVVTGVTAAVGFEIARVVTLEVVPRAMGWRRGSSTFGRRRSAVAAATVLAAVLGPAWQTEGSAPGGAALGALLILLAVRTSAPERCGDNTRSLALILGFSLSYEPLVFASALAACAPWLINSLCAFFASLKTRKTAKQALRARVLGFAAFGLGLAPLAFGFALSHRDLGMGLIVSPFGSAPSERAPWGASLASLVSSEIGTVLVVAAAIGIFLMAWLPSARRLLASLLGVIAVGVLAALLRAPSSNIGAPVLAALVAVHIFSAVALTCAVTLIAGARVPFASVSSAFAVLFVLVFPVRAADEAALRREARMPRAQASWNELAWGSLPPSSILLVSDAPTLRRLTRARATGELRPDLLVVPTSNVRSRRAERALVAEPRLASLYRDLALGSLPEELSLAELARARPLFASFDPSWERALARHFVPVGLTSRFEPESQSASDRRRALEDFRVSRDRLVELAVNKRDRDLAAVTASLLRARAIAVAACGERETLSLALDDLRSFSPDDAVADMLVRRMVTSKGPIDLRDLGVP